MLAFAVHWGSDFENLTPLSPDYWSLKIDRLRRLINDGRAELACKMELLLCMLGLGPQA